MPAKEVDKYAATTWGIDTEDLECPSGQLCLVRRIDIMKLIADGTLDKTEMLTSLVDQKHVSKKAKGGIASAKSQQMNSELAAMRMLKDPEKVAELMHTVNSVVCATVVKPELKMPPEDDSERESSTIYIDQVDLNDRMFIMQYAFAGHRDVARFRREFDESVERLANVETLADPTE